MKVTRFGHSCIRLDDGERRLVLDPGVFSDVASAVAGVDAVLITHEHPDHLDVAALQSALAENPDLHVWAPAAVADGLGERATAVGADEQLTVAGFDVTTHGGQHALIHPLVPVVANIAYVVDGAVLHPGDSFTVVPTDVQLLLLPLQAPWSRVGEVIDYAVAQRAPLAIPIHDALLNENGFGVIERNVTGIAGRFDVEYRHLAGDASLTL